jgi:hypothetical protein
MELHLFQPVPTKMLVTIYGTTLQNVKDGNKSESMQLRLFRLKAELKKLGVAVDKLPGIKLSQEKEAELYKRLADCYEDCVQNMTWSEIMMNYVKLSNYGFKDAATVLGDEMVRRGNMSSDTQDDTVVDSLCRATDCLAMGAM